MKKEKEKKQVASGWIYGRKNACQYLGGISPRLLSRWIALGLIPHKRLSSKTLLFKPSDLDRAIEQMN